MGLPENITPKDWVYEAGEKRLSREYLFGSHLQAADFIREVARIADHHNHHPDVMFTQCSCKVSTPANAKGVSQDDHRLARAIEDVYQRGY